MNLGRYLLKSYLSLIRSWVSPSWARYFFCLAKRSTQEKATPTGAVATQLPCDARSSGPASKLGRCAPSDKLAGRPPLLLRFSAPPKGPQGQGQNPVPELGIGSGDAKNQK